MQDWKIKRMSVKRLERWLDSVDLLLRWYLGKTEVTSMPNCPLCWADCDDCLWLIIERKNCDNFRDELYPKRDSIGVSTLRRYPKYTKWKNARIKQLIHWRLIIESELLRKSVRKIARKKK